MFGSLNIYQNQFLKFPLLTCKLDILYSMVDITAFYPSQNFHTYGKSLFWINYLRERCKNMDIDIIGQFSKKIYKNNEF